jgi:hypothetical protein
MKRVLFICLGLICLSIFIHPSFALGITPARYEVAYEPGKQYDFMFQVRNAVGDLNISKQGELTSYMEMEEGIFNVNPGETKDISVKFTIPSDLTPGKHDTGVLVAELPPNAYGRPGISAVVAVVGQIRIVVPYPQKYAEIKFNAPSTLAGQKAYFTVNFMNYGEQEIQSATGTITVVSGENNITIPLTTEQNIPSMQQTELYGEWDTTGIKAGTYLAAADVLYDGIAANQERGIIQVGDKSILITKINAANISSGSVAKISTDIQSQWNAPLSTYAQFVINSGQDTIADFKSPTTTLQSWSADTLTAYWDASNVAVGTYDLKAILHYEDKTTEASTTINVTEREKGKSTINMPPEQLAILALVVLVIAFGFLIARKKGRGRQQQYWPRYG